MKKSTIVGYPRIGVNRELKKAVEGYLKNDLSLTELKGVTKNLRKEYLLTQKEKGIDYIPSNDFSFYDNMLDTAVLLNIIPQRYLELNLPIVDTYFAMARGYQKDGKDVKALRMKKWFNTNYHYMVPEIEDDMKFSLNDTKPFDLYKEAKELGIETRPTIIGVFTFLKLSRLKTKTTFEECLDNLADVYIQILNKFKNEGIEYLQIDEPILVTDLNKQDIALFEKVYKKILDKKGNIKILLQTYFGDIRDVYQTVNNLNFDGVGLDFIEGSESLSLIEKYGFPSNRTLVAGIINGKNIWRNDYKKSVEIIKYLESYVEPDNIWIGTSCSLLHVPHTLRTETKISEEYKESLSFAEEKLDELAELKDLVSNSNYKESNSYKQNQEIINRKRTNSICSNNSVRSKVNNLKDEDFIRKVNFEERNKIQKELFKLPLLPTTTIGSFPQTQEIRKLRQQFKKNEITETEYEDKIKEKINEIIKSQEEIGLDVLVHGEYERNDMVEYFGQQLEGFLFTQNGWVQSYGTRGVKPPIIYGDIERKEQMTVKWIKYASDQTEKIVKGMLTGPITILNWSFPREDLSLKEIAYQIGLAIGEEVLDLEKAGVKIIQIDEAALREKLPLRKEHWKKDYLDWAIPAFGLTASKVKPETQIHTHMCYSEFSDIIRDIQDMDVDAISIEAARSDFSILDFLKKNNFRPEVGPGIYDIHSPRVPSEEELEKLINIMISKLDVKKLWINPDCGLKTRGIEETKQSLINMIKATKAVREKLK